MKISIVTTAYNIEAHVEKCLDSLLAQTHKDIEIIVVNDCSTDKTMDIVGKFTDERIKVVNHSQNMGAGWARRTGIGAATGEYVITVDGDDWLAPDFIEALAKNAEETDADIVSGGITYVWSDTYEEVKRFLPHVSEGMQKFRDYGDKKIVFLNNKLVRRTMYDTVPYSTRRYCEDTPVILPLLYLANKVSYVDVQGYYYLQHDKSLCRRVNAFEEALFKALCSQEMQAFFGDKGEEYQGLISVPEYIGWLRTIKATITPQLAQIYRSELGEIMPNLLRLVEI
jgi:glycosyltransferase involved in cell wall biosynthesis